MKNLDNNVPNISPSTKEIQSVGRELAYKRVCNRNPLWSKNKIIIYTISGILILFSLLIARIALVKSDDTTGQENIHAELNNDTLEEGKEYPVVPGDVIVVETGSSDKTLHVIGYYFDPLSSYDEMITEHTNRLEIVVPDGKPGSTQTLYVGTVIENDNDSSNTETNTVWKTYALKYNNYTPGKSIRVFVNDVEIRENITTKIKPGAIISVSVTPQEALKKAFYKLGNAESQGVDSSSFSFTIPGDSVSGQQYKLLVNALFADGYYIDNKNADTVSKKYFFMITD